MIVQNATRFVVEAERLLEFLNSAAALRAAAEALVEASARAKTTVVMAASAPGERVIGAAIVLADGELRGWVPGDEEVALFDVALTSGASLASAAARARNLGATQVHAFVLTNLGGHETVPGVDAIFDLDQLFARPARHRLAAV